MKKILTIVLTIMLSLSVIALVACGNAKVVSVVVEGLPEEVQLNDADFYKNIEIIVTYDDGSIKTLEYDSDLIKIEGINTSKTGTKIFKVLCGGKSAEIAYQVISGIVDESVIVTSVSNTDGYIAYTNNIETQTNTEEDFYDKNRGYAVGTDNGYSCVPKVAVLTEDEEDVLENPVTTFKLFQNDVLVENPEKYVRAENNVYYFTADAVGQSYTLQISLAKSYNLLNETTTNTTIKQDIHITEGYNVHDALDLSVLDNLNNNSWANIKAAVRPWNNGKSYGDVRGIIHEKYKDLLVGSVKETCLGEDWEDGAHNNQRGLYVNDGIGVNGNYLKLTYKSGLDKDDNTETDEKGGIYVVYDYEMTNDKTYPLSHTFFIAVRTFSEKTPVFENIYFVGQTKKTDDTETPAGLMMIGGIQADTTVDNVVANQWFGNIEIDGEWDESKVTVNIKNCKFYDSFSQMIYGWYAKEINVTNCELKRAGGPLFILQCATDENTKQVASTLNIDSTANMENWVTGSEAWFAINGLSEITIGQMFQLTGTLNAVDKQYTKGSESSGSRNLIAVMIPEPSKVFTNQYTLYANLNVGDKKYGFDDDVFAALLNLTQTTAKGAELGNALKNAYGTGLDETTQNTLDALINGFSAMSANDNLAALKLAPMFKSGDDYILFDGTAPRNVFGQDLQIAENVQQLYAGTEQVIALLTAQQAPQETIKAWTEVKDGLAPLAKVVSDKDWNDAWKDNDSGYAVMLVNPGGLDMSKPDTNKKHFIVLFGEA